MRTLGTKISRTIFLAEPTHGLSFDEGLMRIGEYKGPV